MQPITSLEFSPIFDDRKVRPIGLQETFRAPYHGDPLPVRGLQKSDPQKTAKGQYPVAPSMSEKLFSALAEVKIWTSNVSMYLDREDRDRIFRQLDILHDEDEWFDGDKPVNLESYKTMIRAVIYHDINCRPALSIMPTGFILALWQNNNDKLTVEFQPKNQTRWLVESHTEKGAERASGTAPLERLRQVLAPYCAARWFDGR